MPDVADNHGTAPRNSLTDERILQAASPWSTRLAWRDSSLAFWGGRLGVDSTAVYRHFRSACLDLRRALLAHPAMPPSWSAARSAAPAPGR